MSDVFVNMGQIVVLRSTGSLVTVGLGSCIGVTLYDRANKVGVMGHIFLGRSRSPQDAVTLPGKYADTGIPAMVQAVLAAGAAPKNLQAKIAGGAHLFPTLAALENSIGYQNTLAVRQQLQRLQLPLTGEATGGNRGRKMQLDVATGRVMVQSIGQQPIDI